MKQTQIELINKRLTEITNLMTQPNRKEDELDDLALEAKVLLDVRDRIQGLRS